MPTVKQFVRGCYNIINAHNPTTTLIDDELQIGVDIINQLLQSYASTGLMITIAKTVTLPIVANQNELTVGAPDVIPVPDITEGRLANLNEAWLTLTGVDYPLINVSQAEFLAAWKYNPLQGLPRFIVVFSEVDVVRLRLYPGPSQGYQFSMRGKFQLPTLLASDNMATLPQYQLLWTKFAGAKQIAFETGRADAWTAKLEAELQRLTDLMEAASEVDLAIVGDRESMLNGSWRVQAGI